jgi:probable HAF family extracellular repeat protein
MGKPTEVAIACQGGGSHAVFDRRDAGRAVMRVGSGTTGWAALFAAAAATAAPLYSVTPVPGTEGGLATAISENGRVAGFVGRSEGNRAFRWNGTGEAEILGTLGGTFSQATGVNAAGTVVGFTADAAGLGRAFRVAGNGPMENLDVLGGPRGAAFAINDAGTIAGNGGGYRDLPAGGTASVSPGIPLNAAATALSANGILAGFYVPPGAEKGGGVPGEVGWQAFRYTGSGPLQPLGSLGGDSLATGVNARGDVVGYHFLEPYPTGYHGFLAAGEGGPLQDLGFMGIDLAINDRRQIVGDRYLWAGGTKYVLDDLLVGGSGWFAVSARAINARGQIGGAACRAENDVRRCFAVRLDPVALPEPPVYWLVLAGALVAVSSRRRGRRGPSSTRRRSSP